MTKNTHDLSILYTYIVLPCVSSHGRNAPIFRRVGFTSEFPGSCRVTTVAPLVPTLLQDRSPRVTPPAIWWTLGPPTILRRHPLASCVLVPSCYRVCVLSPAPWLLDYSIEVSFPPLL
jgi:hypothetical protein